MGGRIHGARGVIGRSHNKRTQKFRILVTNKDSGTFCHVEGTFGENFGGVSARIWLTRKLGKKDRQNHRKEPNHMNREEILAKSRAEKMDEGMQQAENRGRRIGVSAFCCVYVFIVIFNFVQGYPSYGFHAMFWLLWRRRLIPNTGLPGTRDFWSPRSRGRWPAPLPSAAL